MKRIFSFVLIALIQAPAALANIDRDLSDALRWENEKAAQRISDGLLVTSIGGTIAYTAIHQSDRKLERTGAVAAAYVANYGVNHVAKLIFSRERPDGSDRLSFWSGHASTSFVSVGSVCYQGEALPCAIAAGLGVGVAYLRVAGGKHFPSDVMVGAGIGYAAGRYVPTIIVVF